MSPVKIHLDTDIGGDIDDLCALALLLAAPDVEVTGVTTVLEDGGRRAGYARYVLALAGRHDVPVAAGADLSLGYCRLPAVLPPEGRYWPEPVPPAPGPVERALDVLKRSIEQGAIVVGIGPFTNLSLLEQCYPGILGEARLCLMGGTIHPSSPTFPAWDHTMDYNVQADSEAARLVLESSAPTLVPLDVTVQTVLRRSHLPALFASGPLGKLISRQAEVFEQDEQVAERYGRTCTGLPPDIINFQHDPLACAVALGWDGVTIETLLLVFSLEDGRLRMRQDNRGRLVRVVTSVDRERFSSYWLATVTRQVEPQARAPGFAAARDSASLTPCDCFMGEVAGSRPLALRQAQGRLFDKLKIGSGRTSGPPAPRRRVALAARLGRWGMRERAKQPPNRRWQGAVNRWRLLRPYRSCSRVPTHRPEERAVRCLPPPHRG